MTINTRLITGFGIILILMLVITLIGISRVSLINNNLTQITDVNSLKQRYAINYRGSVHDRAIAIRDVVLLENPEAIADTLTKINELEKFYQSASQSLETLKDGMSATEIKLLSQIQKIEQQTTPLISAIISAQQANRTQTAQQMLLNDAGPAFTLWLKVINEFINVQETANQKITQETREIASSFEIWMILCTGLAILIGLTIAYLISVRIKNSVGGEPSAAAHVIANIAHGDLSTQVISCAPDSMMASVETMREKLKVIVNSIMHSSGELSVHAATVSSASQQALSAAQAQVNQTHSAVERLEMMSSSIHTVAGAVRQTEDNSKVTAELSLQGRQAVDKVAAEIENIAVTVKATVGQVNVLQEHVKKIGDILSVIRSISEQTNLLALNAAIEAARAGESGRGFAVVADEVRQLAQRTGEATGDIESMIIHVQENTQASVSAMETTVPQVENGLTLTKEAKHLLNEIQQQANNSLETVLEIVTSTESQVKTVELLSQGVEAIAQMSNETSDSLKGNAAEAEALARLSNTLKQDINYFKAH